MPHLLKHVLALAAFILWVDSAAACRFTQKLSDETLLQSDIAVIGTIANYRVVIDQDARERWRQRNGPAAAMPKSIGILYAAFDIVVEKHLRGTSPDRISAHWNGGNLGVPKDMPPGPRLILLLHQPPVVASASMLSNGYGKDASIILQEPCSRAAIYPAKWEEAQRIQTLLIARSE